MSKTDYHKFSKRVFTDKYKLRGKAIKDNPRQYGMVQGIRDKDKMIAYTIKDGKSLYSAFVFKKRIPQKKKVSE